MIYRAVISACLTATAALAADSAEPTAFDGLQQWSTATVGSDASLKEKRRAVEARSAELARTREQLLIKDSDPEGFGGEEFADGAPAQPVTALKKQMRSELINWLKRRWEAGELSKEDSEWLMR